MRVWISTLFALCASPVLLFATAALAVGWMSYANARFGYAIDIPPGFTGLEEAANSDGQVFRNAGGTQVLTVWGGQVIEDDFEAEVALSLPFIEDEGWNITYRASTPRWVSFSGVDGDHVLYARAIALCGGAQYATFYLEYFVSDLTALKPVVNRLVSSFKEAPSGLNC